MNGRHQLRAAADERQGKLNCRAIRVVDVHDVDGEVAKEPAKLELGAGQMGREAGNSLDAGPDWNRRAEIQLERREADSTSCFNDPVIVARKEQVDVVSACPQVLR